MTNIADMTELDIALDNTKRAIRFTMNDLQSKADSLTIDMGRLSGRMERMIDAKEYTPGGVNSLGEVQTQGHSIDLVCATLVEQQRHLEMLEAMQARTKAAEENTTDV